MFEVNAMRPDIYRAQVSSASFRVVEAFYRSILSGDLIGKTWTSIKVLPI